MSLFETKENVELLEAASNWCLTTSWGMKTFGSACGSTDNHKGWAITKFRSIAFPPLLWMDRTGLAVAYLPLPEIE